MDQMQPSQSSTGPTPQLGDPGGSEEAAGPSEAPAPKKSRTNTPWTPAEEKKLTSMREDGRTWSDIAKARTLSSCGSNTPAYLAAS